MKYQAPKFAVGDIVNYLADGYIVGGGAYFKIVAVGSGKTTSYSGVRLTAEYRVEHTMAPTYLVEHLDDLTTEQKGSYGARWQRKYRSPTDHTALDVASSANLERGGNVLDKLSVLVLLGREVE